MGVDPIPAFALRHSSHPPRSAMQKPPQDRARISGRELALLLDLEYPGQFNAARYRLQKVLDRKTHARRASSWTSARPLA